MKLSTLVSAALGLAGVDALNVGRGGRPFDIIHEPDKRQQDIVTWDEHSLFIHGERAMMFSGEVHPFRMPVTTLWLDVFQKIRAMGFNMVSFYVDWAVLEGKPGEFRADGVFDLEPFFDAATEAGIYLLARPGPYINAEVSGGGFPGWLQSVDGYLRTNDKEYLEATDNYMANICSIIAKAQITNGGPVVLFQPENEYSAAADWVPFPDKPYFQYVIDQANNAGIVVPIINNDVWQGGTNAPGTGLGEVDIYGHDGYPNGFDCRNPTEWPTEDPFPTTWYAEHMAISPNTPYSIIEFQGGAFDPPGGPGIEACYTLTNHEFARVFYKNNMAAGITIFNIYMTFGGTNWGNIGHPGGYTSYDYGAALRENRGVDREKYSEMKLEGQFLQVSPEYLVARPSNLTTGVYSKNKAITITPLFGEDTGSFFVVRHTDHTSLESTSYTVTLPTSTGDIAIPQLGGKLSLHGRDSKFHVVDYAVGDYSLLYSTAEVFTWKKFHDKTVLVLYGGPNELHEVAVKGNKHSGRPRLHDAQDVTFKTLDGDLVFQFKTASTRQVIQLDDLVIYLLDRNAAYKYWVPVLPSKSSAYGALTNPEAVIVNGGYLVRSASVKGKTLSIDADFNATTPLEIIGAPKHTTKLVVNGSPIPFKTSKLGNWVTTAEVPAPEIELPDLSSLTWHALDSLPEVQGSYDDSAWVSADLPTKNNQWPLHTETSLYGADYGFHIGTFLFRGYFTSTGSESEIDLWVQGGDAHGSSVWLNGTFLGSFPGRSTGGPGHNATYTLPSDLKEGETYVVTVVMDNMGLHTNWTPGLDEMKEPRGIIDYALRSPSNDTTPITWKLTGNFGGEDYVDKTRGPLNEGGLFFERQGYHLPKPPRGVFTGHDVSPFGAESNPTAGIRFFGASMPLDLPAADFDIPLSFVFDNATTTAAYRAFIFVNGFQYGRYTSNVGPQTDFHVPEGVLDYGGDNWIGLAVWAMEEDGVVVPPVQLALGGTPVLTGRKQPEVVRAERYKKRRAY